MHVTLIVYFDVFHLVTKKKPPQVVSNVFKNFEILTGKYPWSLKKVVLKNLANFTGKHLCWSLFNKVAANQACNFTNIRLQHRCLPVKFVRYLSATANKCFYKQKTVRKSPFVGCREVNNCFPKISYLDSAQLLNQCCSVVQFYPFGLWINGGSIRSQFLSMTFAEEGLCRSVLDRKVIQRRMYNPVKHLRWSFLWK